MVNKLYKIFFSFSKQPIRFAILWSLTFLLQGCNLIDYHPYDGKIEDRNHWNLYNIDRIKQSTNNADTIRFAVISDTQRWYDETEDEVNSINQRDDINFVIHCGDISDFGFTNEFEWQCDILDRLKVPYIVLLGNHDCLGTGKEVYNTLFGKENFAFTAGTTRFVCLNTNALEYDYSNPVPDLNFIENEADNIPEGIESTVVVMHAKPFDEQFNNNIAEPFQYYLHKLKNPMFGLCGHGHETDEFDLFDDGFIYYEITCAKYRQYYIFTVYGSEYSYETIDY